VLVDALDPSDDPPDRKDEHPELASRLRGLLDAQLAQEGRIAPSLSLDAESRLRLESLGYGEGG
jgi:hypothetical protein